MDTPSRSCSQPGACLAMVRIANVKPREMLRRMGLVPSNRDHVYFYHAWLNIGTKISHGDKELNALLMGKIALDDLKMNSVEEFRAALRGNIPARYLDPNAPWDGQPLD